MIEVGDFIMDWHNIYIVKKILDEEYIWCEEIRWWFRDSELKVEEGKKLIAVYMRLAKDMEHQSGSRKNVVYPQAINSLIKMAFEYMKGR